MGRSDVPFALAWASKPLSVASPMPRPGLPFKSSVSSLLKGSSSPRVGELAHETESVHIGP